MRLIAVTAVVVLASSAVFAEDAPKPPFRQLIGAGYEVKDVTVIPTDQLAPMGYEVDTPLLLVTLQLGNSVAVCQFAVANWSQLSATSVDGTTQCDVMNAEPVDPPAPTIEGGPQALAQPPSEPPEPPPAEPPSGNPDKNPSTHN